MAEIVLTKAMVRVGSSQASTNITSWVTGVTVNYAAELIDKTAMGVGSRGRMAGLKDWSITVDLNQDFADNTIDEILYDLVGISESSKSWIHVKATTAKGSATNPRYYGHSLLEGYSPLAGAVGELAKTSVTFQADGTRKDVRDIPGRRRPHEKLIVRRGGWDLKNGKERG